MSSRSSGPANRPVAIALCLMAVAFAMAIAFTATAEAARYKMVLCAGNNGSNSFSTATNTTSPQNPGGIFSIENHCGPAPDPAGGSAFLRISENQAAGNAGHGAYGSVSWTVPNAVSILAGGGWTRQPGSFNDGWRTRFWAEDHGGGGHHILMQGAGVSGGGIFSGTTSTFAPHLWPFGSFASYRRFVYEMTCVRPAGCDRSGWNASEANTFVLILDDTSPSQVSLTKTEAPLLGGQWVRGTQSATYRWSDQGSGIRFERLQIDGAERFAIDHIAANQCDRDASQSNGEFARKFQPCPTASDINRTYSFDTASLADGQHTVQVCTQDYGQWQGLNGTGGQSCDQRTIRTDNTAPGAPAQLVVNSANPERYLDRFGATFTLPPNQGSPITKVHYSIVDGAGRVVVPERTASGTNPISLSDIEGKKEPGAYRLQVRLEDAVGLIGPAALAPIPRDTKPPAAPQNLSVVSPSVSRSAQGFDVRWHNLQDAGSPIDAVHYQVLSGSHVVVPTKTLKGEDPQAVANLDAPRERGAFTLRLWLSDAEGNVGAPVTAPLAYDCVRSEVGGGSSLSAGFGARGEDSILVRQGEGATLRGRLAGLDGQRASAPLCVFSRVITDQDRRFLGIAMTDEDGGYSFAIGAGPSQELSAVYRSGQRELSSRATLRTRVRPGFRLHRRTIRNKGFATFSGAIPGPNNDQVIVVLQVKSGKAWRVFRRYRTRASGRFLMRYRFTQTTTPTTYIMRAQVRAQSGYPYEQGNSVARRLEVLP